MMTCREVLDSLSSFIDEDLKQEVRQEMHKHIHVCSDCRAHFDSMTMTIKLYRHEAKPEVPAECHDRLVKVLQLEQMKAQNSEGATSPAQANPAAEATPAAQANPANPASPGRKSASGTTEEKS